MDIKSSINQRVLNALNLILQAKKKGDLAKELGVTPSKISEILNNRMNAGTDIMQYLCSHYQINAEWLLLGKGEMFQSQQAAVLLPELQHANIESDIKYSGIPFIEKESDIMEIANSEIYSHTQVEHYKIPMFENKGVEYLMRVPDNSMYPRYSNGDILACRPVSDKSFIQWGRIYLLYTGQGAFVKRLFPVEKNAELLECRSDNREEFPAFSIHKEAVWNLSIIIGIVRFE